MKVNFKNFITVFISLSVVMAGLLHYSFFKNIEDINIYELVPDELVVKIVKDIMSKNSDTYTNLYYSNVSSTIRSNTFNHHFSLGEDEYISEKNRSLIMTIAKRLLQNPSNLYKLWEAKKELIVRTIISESEDNKDENRKFNNTVANFKKFLDKTKKGMQTFLKEDFQEKYRQFLLILENIEKEKENCFNNERCTDFYYLRALI